MSFRPAYEWLCYACSRQNEADTVKCDTCGCPANVTIADLEIYRSHPLPAKPRAAAVQGLKRHQYEYSVFIIGAVVVLVLSFFPFLKGSFKDLPAAGLMGDFFGGYVGTFISLASVALLLGTLRAQHRATAQQNFENKYFELVKLHRDNVAEFSVGSHDGRKVFVSLFREYQAILDQVIRFCRQRSEQFKMKDFLVIAYFAFFYGVGPNSSRMLRVSLRRYSTEFARELDIFLRSQETRMEVKLDAEIDYEPLDGHQSRLGHYYRHLFQTVTYVDDQPFINNKYEYVKTIRAQLTNYEQALFIINSLTPMGRVWWERDLIVKYNFAKNIPLGFFNPSITNEILRAYGGRGNFEWEEYDDD